MAVLEYLLTPEEMTDADHAASEQIGISSQVLMERAALALADAVCHKFPEPCRVVSFAGKGNNGADGVAAARILRERGYAADVLLMAKPAAGSELEHQVLSAEHIGVRSLLFNAETVHALFHKENATVPVIIDAVFGTGFDRAPRGTALEMIRCINDMEKYVISADIPSGVSGLDGSIPGEAVKADETVTFAWCKRGHFLYPGRSHTGELHCADIGITKEALQHTPAAFTLAPDDRAAWLSDWRRKLGRSAILPDRDPSGNKGTFGKVLLIAGDVCMSGAAVLAAKACYRAGAGMVRVFTPESNRVIVQEAVPEALLTVCPDGSSEEDINKAQEKLKEAFSWCDTIAIGPGLGQSERAKSLVRSVLEAAAGNAGQDGDENHIIGRKLRGLVIDADAIRLIAKDTQLKASLADAGLAAPVIMTPHLAECADLLHADISDLKSNKERVLHVFADLYHVVLVCKDAATMIAFPKRKDVYLNITGNDGLATAGSGDVLTGITAGLLAQTMPRDAAAGAAVYLHGLSADIAAMRVGRRSLVASDVIDYLQDALFVG